MSTYTALLRRTAAQQFRVTFPDFEGLSCTAITQDLIKPLAEAVLASQMEEMCSKGITPPEPCSLQDALRDDVESIALLIDVQARYNADFRTRLEQFQPTPAAA